MRRNPNHKDNFGIQGYKDLGWQNEWKTKPLEHDKKGNPIFVGYEDQPEYENCNKLGHQTRRIDNSLFQFRGTDNIVICDECKIYSHYDCSD